MIILTIMLIADIFNGIIRELIVIFGTLRINILDENILAIAFFSTITLNESIAALFFTSVLVIILTLVIGIYLLISCIAKKKCRTSRIIEFVGVLLYFIGSNINYIIIKYGHALDCLDDCNVIVRYFSTFLLGVAVLLYSIIPTELSSTDGDGDNGSGIDQFFNPIATIVKVAALYKAVASGIDDTGVCSTTNVAFTSLFLCICIIGGGMLFVFSGYKHGTKENLCTVITSFAGVAIPAIVPFLLADNIVPLQCGFKCGLNDTTLISNLDHIIFNNMTELGSFARCNREAGFIRLVLFVICLFGFAQIIARKCCQWCKSKC